MAVDWNFTKLKEQALAKYDKQYWSNIAGTYTQMGGRINWDSDTGTASYSKPNIPLPSLPAMWSQYQKGAKSRGAVPDFMTFKKYYDQLKTIKNQQMVSSLQQAQLSGIPLNKIHDAIRTNPGFRDELVKTIANTADENQRAALSQFVPPIEKSLGEEMTPGVLTGLTAASLAGIGYTQGMVDDTPEGIAERTRRAQFAERDRLRQYIKNNPKPVAPVESDYKSKKGHWKRGGKVKYTADQTAYQKKLAEWRAGRPQPTVDPKITRWDSWMKKGGGPKSTQHQLVKGGAIAFAPEAIGMLARQTGLKESDVNKLQGIAASVGTAYYGKELIQGISKALTSGKGFKALKGFGPWGNLAAMILTGAQAAGYFNRSGESTNEVKEPKKKPYQSVV